MAAILRPCSTSAGFTATPDKPVRLALPAVKRRLAEAGFAIVLDARVLLIVRKGGVESSVYDDGKVLLKTTDRAKAEAGYAALEPYVAGAHPQV